LSKSRWRARKMGLRFAVFPIQQVPHSLFSSIDQFTVRSPVRATGASLSHVVIRAARWATIGKAGLIRPQFELFRANAANLHGKGHGAEPQEDHSRNHRRNPGPGFCVSLWSTSGNYWQLRQSPARKTANLFPCWLAQP